MRDVIVIAILMASHVSDIPGLDAALNGLGAARRLSLDEAQRLAVTRDSAAEVTALSQALGS